MYRRQSITHAANIVDESEWSKKKYVWVPNNRDSYDLAKLKKAISQHEIEAEIEDTGEIIRINYDQCDPVNPPKFDNAEDMADLTRLNIPSVLHLLKKRYHRGQIYTYSGLFCVVINPYKQLPIYGNANMDRYKGKKRHEIEPHVYAVTDNAYRDMLANREDQSILCTGESGAGKTENTKKVIQHLTFIAGNKSSKNDLEKQIIQSNPILEAFGNAKTVKNDNSSRFGKFIRVNFDHSGFIAGASINHYILEKARVIRQSEVGKERNFHIFYQLLAGANPALAQALHLEPHSNYRFLTNNSINIPGVNDQEEYNVTCEAMRTMNMSEDDIKKVFMVISGVLLLGNITVDSDRSSQQSAMFPDSTSEVNRKFCDLAGVDIRQFNNALLKPKIKAGIQMVTKNQKKEQVEYAIEAIAKAIYDRLFLYLVKRINHAMQLSIGNPGVNFLGILDIAGFEIFKTNSFEQLCINLTNEKLQQLFNHTLFVKEQEEYQREKIEWNQIDFGLDLVSTINLIEGTVPVPGVIALLDQACLFPNADDDYFKTLVHKEHQKTNNLLMPKGLEQGFDFAIQHYAGRVDYDCSQWLKKNMDQLNDNVISLLGASKNSLMRELFLDAKEISTRQRTMAIQQMTPPPRKGGGAGKGMRRTVGALYRDQLNRLMTTLNATEAHFVRCIIPNHQKKAGYLDEKLVIDQLKCNGVIEGIRIVRKGYPNRQTFSDFRQRYGLLCPSIANSLNSNSKVVCMDMLLHLELKEIDYRVGETKIFFKNGVLAQLEERRDFKLEQIMVKIQARARGYLARKRLKNKAFQERAIRILQKNANIYLNCRQWQWWMLFNKIKPLLAMRVHEDAMQASQAEVLQLKKEQEKLVQANTQLAEDCRDLKEELESHTAELYEAQERNTIMEDAKINNEAQINELQESCQILKERIYTEETLQQRCRDDLMAANNAIDGLKNDLHGAICGVVIYFGILFE